MSRLGRSGSLYHSLAVLSLECSLMVVIQLGLEVTLEPGDRRDSLRSPLFGNKYDLVVANLACYGVGALITVT